jgi:hypothetical protein
MVYTDDKNAPYPHLGTNPSLAAALSLARQSSQVRRIEKGGGLRDRGRPGTGRGDGGGQMETGEGPGRFAQRPRSLRRHSIEMVITALARADGVPAQIMEV